MEVFYIKALDENGQVKGMLKNYNYEGFPSEELQKYVAKIYGAYLIEITKGIEIFPFE